MDQSVKYLIQQKEVELKELEISINKLLYGFQKTNKCGLFVDIKRYAPTVIKLGLCIEVSNL